MDRIGADFENALKMMVDRLGAHPLVMQIPWGSEERFRGVIDLVRQRCYIWDDDSLGAQMSEIDIPAEMAEAAEEARVQMIETVAETDDALMEAYLNEEEITSAQLVQAVRQATVRLKVVPVFCGAALRNRGVQPLLEAIVDFLPSPLDVPEPTGTVPGSGETKVIPSDEKGPLAGLVFKIQMEQGRKQSYVRLYSGKVAVGSDVLNVRTGQKEKIARILRMHANKRERIEQAMAGDLVAIVGLKSVTTGDTITDPGQPLLLESITAYEPVINVALEPKVSADLEKVVDTLGKLAEEDPTFHYHVDEDTGQTIISGMGELHLDVIVHRLGREFNVDLNVGKPQVVYRETVTETAQAEGRFERELGGSPHFAAVKLEIRPLKRGAGISIASRLSPESLPDIYLEATRDAIGEGLKSGVVMGYPMLDVQVEIVAAEFREGVSTTADFRVAASQALQNTLRQAKPILLEPIMSVEVTAPEEFTGEVINDLNSRHGKIENIVPRKTVRVVTALVPLSKMFGYSTAIRSATQGRGTFTMRFSLYDSPDRK